MRYVVMLLIIAGSVAGCAPDKEAQVDELFTEYAGVVVPGAAVRVLRDGEPVLTRTYGVADIATQRAIGVSSNFRLASISKQFTALAILMLIDEGRLSFDTPLSEVFPEFPPYANRITIRHLLQHQSGLPDYEPMVPGDATEQVHDADVLAMMMTVEQGEFEPGTEYHYSNSGYAVLAMVVEAVSGSSFSDFLKQRIFGPAGMRDTVAFVNGRNTVSERAHGYTVTDAGVEYTDQSLYSAVLGDGGVYSSLRDLTRWDRAGYGRDLVSAGLMEAMLTPALENYGFGWRIDEYDGQRRYHHSGSTSGFRNFIQRFPEQRLTIVVLTNRAEPDVQPLGEAIADLYLD